MSHKFEDVKDDIKEEDKNISKTLTSLAKEGREKTKLQTEQDFSLLLNEQWPRLKERIKFFASQGDYQYYFSKEFPDLYRKVNQRYDRHSIHRRKIFTAFLKEKGLKSDLNLGRIYWKDDQSFWSCLMCLCCEDKQIETYY